MKLKFTVRNLCHLGTALLLPCLLHTLLMDVAADGDNPVEKASDYVDKVAGLTESIGELLEGPQTLKALQTLSTVLSAAGPIFLGVSLLLSVVSEFTGPKESEEMAALKDGFERMNSRLNTIEKGIHELKNLVLMSSVQVGYLKDTNTIDNLFKEWKDLSAGGKVHDASKKDFTLTYIMHYQYAAMNLWRGMVPSGGNVLAFDILDVYKNYVNCNPVKVQLFCISILHYINKGLAVEGAYHGWQGDMDNDKEARSKAEWTERLAALTGRCTAMATECDTNWKQHAQKRLTEVMEENVNNENNEEIAVKIYNSLAENAPQLRWAVWVHKSTNSRKKLAFTEYNFVKYVESDSINKDKRRMAVAVGLHNQLDPPEDMRQRSIEETLKNAAAHVQSNSKCDFFNRGYYYEERAVKFRNKVDEYLGNFPRSIIYVIYAHNNPAFKAAEGRFVNREVKEHCLHAQVYVFQ